MGLRKHARSFTRRSLEPPSHFEFASLWSCDLQRTLLHSAVLSKQPCRFSANNLPSNGRAYRTCDTCHGASQASVSSLRRIPSSSFTTSTLNSSWRMFSNAVTNGSYTSSNGTAKWPNQLPRTAPQWFSTIGSSLRTSVVFIESPSFSSRKINYFLARFCVLIYRFANVFSSAYHIEVFGRLLLTDDRSPRKLSILDLLIMPFLTSMDYYISFRHIIKENVYEENGWINTQTPF